MWIFVDFKLFYDNEIKLRHIEPTLNYTKQLMMSDLIHFVLCSSNAFVGGD